MKRKTIFVAALVAALSCGSALSSFATGWESVGADWKYLKDDGKYAAAEWVNPADGKWYYLKADTIMARGWFLDPTDNHWYFLDSNGAVVTGLVEINGNVYYMNETHDGTYGALYVGQKVINGVTYTFTENGTTGSKPSTPVRYNSDGSAVAVKAAPARSGGGYISGGVGSFGGTTTTDLTEQKMDAVKDGMAEVVKNNKIVENIVVAEPNPSGVNNVEVVLAEDVSASNIDNVQTAAKNAVAQVLNRADSEGKIIVSVGTQSKEYANKEAALADYKRLINTWVTVDNYETYLSATAELKVPMGESTVTYAIGLAEAE